MNRECMNCGRVAPAGEQMYSLRIDMFARAEPLVFTAEELSKAHDEKLQSIINEMENCDAEEASDQVFERYTFDLCTRCRSRFHRQLKKKAKLHANG